MSRWRAILLLMSANLFASSTHGQEPAVNEREARAIAAIERLGGKTYRPEPGQPVNNVTFYQPIDDADLDSLPMEFPALRSLTIYKGHITDAGVARLAGLTQLERLRIEHCPITDAGVDALAKPPRLHDVDLIDTQITPAGTAWLKQSLPYAMVRVRREMPTSHFERELWKFLILAGLIGALGGAWAVAIARSVRIPPARRRWLCKVPVVVAAVAMMTAGLVRLIPVMSPVQEKSPAEFWLLVTGIDIGVENPYRSFGRVHRPRNGWYIASAQGFHGSDLYRVRATEAAALFPKVVERLRNAPPGALSPLLKEAYRDWARSAGSPDDAAGFIDRLRETSAQRLQVNSPQAAEEVRNEKELSARWERAERYYMNVLFELAFLNGLILFAAWPWLRGAGRRAWALHLDVLPTLFSLPYWLGYAPLTFTSTGPVGGVLYPGLLWAVTPRGLPWTGLDLDILRHIPQILEPLSQTTGPMLSLSSFGGPAPSVTLACGLGVALTIILAPKLCRILTINRQAQ
jgi:hypothetical protein